MKRQTKIAQIVKSDMAKNSAKLISANVIAQIIGLCIYPILTRLYSPDDFGLFNLFCSIGGILVILATAEYQNAIVLPKDENKAQACVHIGLFVTLIVTAICIVTIPFSTQIAGLFDAPDLALWWWLMPAYVFLQTTWNVLSYWYTRKKCFGNVSGYQISQSISNAAFKTGFGYLNFVKGGLIVSAVISPLISITISIFAALKNYLKPLFSIDKTQCREVAAEYKNFPIFSLPRAIVNNLSSNLPVLLLTPFFGLTEIGYFGMAVLLAFTPINLICRSLYQTFLQHTTECVQNQRHIKPFFTKYISATLLIVVPSFALLYFILPWLTELLLGTGWNTTGEYIQLMLPWLIMVCVVSPICYISDIFQKQKIGFLFEILIITCRTIGLIIGIYFNNLAVAIIGYSISSAIVILGQLIWLIHLVNQYERELI